MSRITLDLDALVVDGRLSKAEAERLAGMAIQHSAISTLIQVLFILGALGLAYGVMALKPDPVTGMALATLAIILAVVAQATRREDLALLGTAIGISGTVGLCGSIGLEFGETLPAAIINGVNAAIICAVAILLRSRFLAALAPLAIAALLGSSAAYWYASYTIIVRDPAITIVAFAALSGIIFLAANRLEEVWSGMATVAGRVSWIVMNFGFWVGSLWGDHVGDGFVPSEDAGDSLETFRAGAVFIADWVFIFGWAATSLLTIVFLRRNRFAVNASITFLAINVYTQFFEWFSDEAIFMLTSGVALLAFAFGLFRLDRWMVSRARGEASRP